MLNSASRDFYDRHRIVSWAGFNIIHSMPTFNFPLFSISLCGYQCACQFGKKSDTFLVFILSCDCKIYFPCLNKWLL